MVQPVKVHRYSGEDWARMMFPGGLSFTRHQDSRETAQDGRPSPDYVQIDDSICNQNTLAKVLPNIQDTEIEKLVFTESCFKPYEYERWISSVKTSMERFHPEIGVYWNRISRSAEATYHMYLKDVRVSRASMQPAEQLNRTPIETRIEIS